MLYLQGLYAKSYMEVYHLTHYSSHILQIVTHESLAAIAVSLTSRVETNDQCCFFDVTLLKVIEVLVIDLITTVTHSFKCAVQVYDWNLALNVIFFWGFTIYDWILVMVGLLLKTNHYVPVEGEHETFPSAMLLYSNHALFCWGHFLWLDL